MNKKLGIQGAVDYLSRLLSFAVRDDAKALAARLVEKYGTIDLVASAGERELLSIPGMTRSAVLLLKVTSALTSRRITDSVEFGKQWTEAELTDFLIGLYHGVSVETVYMFILDSADRVICCEYMGEGTVAASDVYPRRLLETAIKAGASAVILAHNHPRGLGKPSKDDITSTQKLDRLFRNAGVELRTHYIVSERDVGRVELPEDR